MDVDLSTHLAELERRSLLPADRLAVLIVGSVARGWANPGSDCDIYVVTKSTWRGEGTRTVPVPLRPATVLALVVHVDGRRWELKYWMDSQVDQMLAKVNWEQFEHGASSLRALTEGEELFLERIMTALPMAGHEWLARRRTDVEASAFQAFVTARSLADSDGAVEDALGQLAVDDVESAVLSARKALGHAVDALLESVGHYGSQTPKWRVRRFRDANPPQLSFARYWALETMRDFDPAAPHIWVEQVVSLCKDLCLKVEIR